MADKAIEEADAPYHLQATKLANVLFTYELQRRFGKHGIQVGSCPTAKFLAAADCGMASLWIGKMSCRDSMRINVCIGLVGGKVAMPMSVT